MASERHDWRIAAGELAAALLHEGIEQRIAAAIARVPRHRFVPCELEARAYDDGALPIGHDQTISQPFIVAFMTQALAVRAGERVLEIGTGSGYQTAVLAELGADVYSVEILADLSARAAATLAALGYGAVHLRVGDGAAGWPEYTPYACVLVTAASRRLPDAWLAQLAPEGRIVAPLEDLDGTQSIWKIVKRADGAIARERLISVRFVPLTGAYER